jgi:hypothetical protein
VITLSRDYIGYHVIITVIRLCPDTFGGDLAFGRPNARSPPHRNARERRHKRALRRSWRQKRWRRVNASGERQTQRGKVSGQRQIQRVLINKTLSTKSAYQEDLITEDASQQLVDSW